MTLVEAILILLKASIVLTVFAFALNATLRDATCLFRKPSQLARSVLSMNIIMPVVAALLVALFDLHPAVEIALMALSVSPVPPILPKKALNAGGRESYTIGLLIAAALLAIILVPLAMEVLQRAFGVPLGMSPWAVAVTVLVSIIAPLAAGILLHAIAPSFAEKLARPVAIIAGIMLIAGAVPVLIAAWPAITTLIGNGSVAAFAVFGLVGLAAGHVLGGPDSDDRTVLALSTASRHPGIAIAIAHTNFPQQKLAMAAVLLYLLVGVIVSIPYMSWSKHRHAGVPQPPESQHPARA